MKKKDDKPKKVIITFEAEESPTKCCECTFGGICPYTCYFSNKIDCSKINLATLELKEIKYGSEEE